MSIISDEELYALLEGVDAEGEEFRPLCLYALDDESYRQARRQSLPAELSLRRVEPQAHWQWSSWFGKSQFALYSPALYSNSPLNTVLHHAHGVLPVDGPWRDVIDEALLAWHQWLASQRVIVLEDHPFQGSQIAALIRQMGPACDLVADGAGLLMALKQPQYDWLISDLALAGDDAIHVLGSHPSLSLPVILLSAHDQTLVDGAARLLADKGVRVVGAFTKPLEPSRLLPVLYQMYEGRPTLPARRTDSRRIQNWSGASLGVLATRSATVPVGERRWVLLASLDMNWEAVKQWLAEQGRSPAELTLVVRSQDALLSLPDRFSLALQARLAGATLALLIDRPERLSFELLERLPLEAILLGYRVQPQLDHGGMLDSFLQRTRERGCQIYLDDPYALLDARWWEERGFHGRW